MTTPDAVPPEFYQPDTNEAAYKLAEFLTGGYWPQLSSLRPTLKAEVDEVAWAELYATQSRPFDRPETGKIAVKVIDHYGDEVLKVFGV